MLTDSEGAVSPVIAVILVVFITIALAVGVFVMLGGLASDQGTTSTSYSDFSSDESSYSATLMDSGNADSLTYLVNGNPVYTVTDVQNNVGSAIPLSEYTQLCAGDELVVVGGTGASENVMQQVTIEEDINCMLPETSAGATAEYDGTSWIVETSLTNTGDEPRDYSILITDGDTYESVETVTLDPGESTTTTTTTSSFDSDAPLRVGIVSPTGTSSDYQLSGSSSDGTDGSDGSSSVSYSGGSSVGSAFYPAYTGDSSGSSTSSSSTASDSTLQSTESGSPVSLSANRVASGDTVKLFATLTTTKETADESLVVRATDADGTTTEKSQTEYTLTNGEYTDAVEEFSFSAPGEYLITATLAGTGEVHTAGTVTVVAESDIQFDSTSLSPENPRVGEDISLTATLSNVGDADGTITVQFFEHGDVFSETEVTVPNGDTDTVTTQFTPDAQGEYIFHVGSPDTAEVREIGTAYADPASAVSVTVESSSTDVELGESVEFTASATHSSGESIEEYRWTFDDGQTETTTTNTVTHTYESEGTYEYSVTAVAADGESGTARALSNPVQVTDTTLYASCEEILAENPSVQGEDRMYTIQTSSGEQEVFCDMTTDGGGWTLVATLSNDDARSWDWKTDVWRTDSTIASTDPTDFSQDYKSAAFAEIAVTDVQVRWQGEGVQATGGCFDGTQTLPEYFGSIWGTSHMADTTTAESYHKVCSLSTDTTSQAAYDSTMGGLGFGVRDERSDGDRAMIGYWSGQNTPTEHYITGLGDRDESVVNGARWRDAGIDHNDGANAQIFIR